MPASCAQCGACCDPVLFDDDTYRTLRTWTSEALRDAADPATEAGWAHWREHGWDDSRELAVAWFRPDGTGRANADFVTAHWHALGDGEYRCDAFDPATRLCGAHDARPPVCRGFPWYSDGPTPEGAAGLTGIPQCSFLADVPPGDRPEGSRPLIPITVLH